jgi:hypothetical protein
MDGECVFEETRRRNLMRGRMEDLDLEAGNWNLEVRPRESKVQASARCLNWQEVWRGLGWDSLPVNNNKHNNILQNYILEETTTKEGKMVS